MKKEYKIIWVFILTVMAFLLQVLNAQTSSATITKYAQQTAAPGDLITYKIVFDNNGSTLLHDVIIKDYLPNTNCQYVSSSPSGVYNSATNMVTWTKNEAPMLEVLNAGSYVFYVTVRVGTPGVAPNQYTGTGGYYIPSPQFDINNKASIQSNEITAPVMSGNATATINQICTAHFQGANGILKSATDLIFEYRVIIVNTGNVWNKFNLSSVVTSGQSLNQSFHEVSTGNAITSTPWIAPGEFYGFIYRVQSPQGTNPNQYVHSNVTATPVACGAPVTKEFVTWICGGQCSGFIVVSMYKIDTPDPVQSGDTLQYHIVISNSDNKNPMTNVTLTETYPPNITLISADPPPTTGNNIWHFANLPYGTTTVHVTALVANDLPNGTQLTNNVALSKTGETTILYSETTTVLSAPELEITKTADKTQADPGEIITYTITYKNNGNRTAPNAIVIDNYNETYVSAVASSLNGATDNGDELRWNLGSLAPGATGSYTYQMQVKTNPGLFNVGLTSISNYANITSDLPDSDIINNNAQFTVNVLNLPDIAVTKNATPSPAVVGGNLNYTITVSNVGEVAHNAGKIVVIDYLPANTTYLSSSPVGVYNSTANTITWEISNTLLPNANEVFQVEISDITCNHITSSLSNKVTAYSDTYGDNDLDNNEYTLLTSVIDNTPPTVVCVANQERSLSGNAQQYNTQNTEFDPVSYNDNCPGTLTLSYSLTGATTATDVVSNTLNNVAFGIGSTTVTWKVVDANNNVQTCSFDVVVLSPITFTYSVSEVECFGENNGEIVLNVTGGKEPFQFSKNNGSTWDNADAGNNRQKTYTGLSATDYQILVRDDLGTVSDVCSGN